MATADRFFGFDTIQRRTLAILLAEVAGDPTAIAAINAAIADLDDRVTVLEDAP